MKTRHWNAIPNFARQHLLHHTAMLGNSVSSENPTWTLRSSLPYTTWFNSKTQVMVLEDLDTEALKSVLRRMYISWTCTQPYLLLGCDLCVPVRATVRVPKLRGIHPYWEHDRRRFMEEYKRITMAQFVTTSVYSIDIQYSFRTIRNHSHTSAGWPCGCRTGSIFSRPFHSDVDAYSGQLFLSGQCLVFLKISLDKKMLPVSAIQTTTGYGYTHSYAYLRRDATSDCISPSQLTRYIIA